MDAQFLEALLHDLKGPVSRCRMLGELLIRRAPDLGEEPRLLVEHIQTSATAAIEVLEAVRRYADAMSLGFHPTRFDLGTAVDGAVACLAEQIRAAGAQITYRGLPEAFGDRAQIMLVFLELIRNALRFRSADPPRIEITAAPRESDSQWLISVADNGMGLPDADPERIFRPFARFASGSRPAIGLTICRHIARRHGGDVTAARRPHGAEVRLRLPQLHAAVREPAGGV